MSGWRGAVVALLLLATAPTASRAQTAPEAMADPALELRARRIEAELRCVVCQNQTLADSNAPLAVDLRREIRQQLGGGASEAEIQHFLVARYGEFVLYRPTFESTTALLWTGPFVLLLLGAAVLARALRRQASLDRDPLGDADGV